MQTQDARGSNCLDLRLWKLGELAPRLQHEHDLALLHRGDVGERVGPAADHHLVRVRVRIRVRVRVSVRVRVMVRVRVR